MLDKLKSVFLWMSMILSGLGVISFGCYLVTAKTLRVRKKWLGVH